MKKLFLSAVMALVLATSAVASDTNSLFKANEFSLTASSGYIVDTAKAFDADYTANLSVGAGYFLTKNFGIDASVPLYQTDGVSVNEVQASLVARLPLQTPIVQIAPYIGFGAIYSWDANTDEYSYRVRRKTVTAQYDDQEWAYVARLGIEGRINSKWGVFAEGQYRNADFESWQDGSVKVIAGLRLVF
jgi:outer membrane protein W